MTPRANEATSNQDAAPSAAPLTLSNRMDECLRALAHMTEELRDALVQNDVERVRHVSERQAEWASIVSTKLHDGSLDDGSDPKAVRQLAKSVSNQMAVNAQLLEDGLAVARYALGAMTGPDERGGVYGSNGMIRGQETSGRPGAGASSSHIVRRTV